MADYESTEEILEEQSATSDEANAEAVAAEASTDVEQETAQPEWNGEEWTLKFRDQPYVPQSRDELINLAQRGKLYDTKQSEISERAKELDTRSERVKEIEGVMQSIESNPRFKQQLMDMYYSNQVGGGQQQEGQAAIPPEYAEKLATIEQRVEQYEQAKADDSLSAELDSLKGANGSFDWDGIDTQGNKLEDQVMRAAHDMGGVPLEVAFNHIMKDQIVERAKAEALKAAQEAKQVQATKGKAVVAPRSQAPAVAPQSISSKSYDDLAREAIAELGA